MDELAEALPGASSVKPPSPKTTHPEGISSETPPQQQIPAPGASIPTSTPESSAPPQTHPDTVMVGPPIAKALPPVAETTGDSMPEEMETEVALAATAPKAPDTTPKPETVAQQPAAATAEQTTGKILPGNGTPGFKVGGKSPIQSPTEQITPEISTPTTQAQPTQRDNESPSQGSVSLCRNNVLPLRPR